MTAPNIPVGLTLLADATSIEAYYYPDSTGPLPDTYRVYLVPQAPNGLFTTTSSTYCKIENLTPNTQYSVTVSAGYLGEFSAQSAPVLITTDSIPIPSAPTNLQTNTVTETSLNLTWDAVAGADKYQVYKDGAAYGGLIGTTSSAIVGLVANESYTMAVKAYDSTYSVFSSPAEVTAYTKLTAPAFLSFSIPTLSGFTLSWASVVGATGYNVYVNGNMHTALHEDTSLVVSDLASNTNYTIDVAAYKATSGESASVTISNALTKPNAPTSLTESGVSSSAFTLNWTAPTGNGTLSYQVYKDGQPYGTTSSTSLLISGLAPQTAYSMTVDATNASGTSAESTAASLSTIPATPSYPTNFRQTDAVGVLTSMAWDAVSGADSYKIYTYGYLLSGVTYSGTTAQWNSPGINRTNPLTVRAVSSGIESDDSQVVNICAMPEAPQTLTVSAITNNSATLTWNAPTGYHSSQQSPLNYRIYIDGVLYQAVGDVLTYNVTGLDGGTSYDFTVTSSNEFDKETVPSPVASALTVPSAPSALTFSNLTADGFDLSWRASSGTGLEYQVYFNGVAHGDVQTGTSLSVTGIGSNTLTSNITVRASNTTGEGADSNAISILTLPAIPTNVVASNITDDGFDLAWTSVANINYQVYFDGVESGSVNGISTRSFTGLGSNIKVNNITVVAINSSGNSAHTVGINVVTKPSAPTLLEASNNEAEAFTLGWTAPTGDGDLIYRVYQDGVIYDLTAATSLQIESLSGNNSYDMKVVAINISGESADSDILPVLTKPDAPTTLVESNITTTSFDLSWTAPVNNTGLTYQVYKNGTTYGSPITDTSLSITNLSPNTTFSMTVTAINGSGESVQSSSLDVLTLPDAVTNLVASNLSTTSFDLSWTASAGTGLTYQVYKDGLPYGSTQAGTSISVTSLTANTSYTMTVTAINGSGESAQSASLNAVTAPEAPTNLVESNITTTSFDLSWTASAGTGLTYQVYKDGIAYGSPITGTSLSITGLTSNTSYTMTVSAINNSGEATSTTLDVLTLPDAVTNLVSSAQTTNTITIDWDTPVGGADSYKVYVDGVEQTGITINNI